jgi:predicted Zn-dependent protease
VYDEVLKENPANSLIMKRKVAVFRTQGKNTDAVTELHSILRLFPADTSSWIELADLHTSLSEYSAAAHCYEEIVLIDPHNPHTHTRLADCYVQMNGVENLILARKHYVTSLESMSAQFNKHALHGLTKCCQLLLETSKGNTTTSGGSASMIVSEMEKLVTEELLKWSKEQK